MDHLLAELMTAPFDQITFEDLRIQRLCARGWATLGATTIAEAARRQIGPLSGAGAATMAARLVAWARWAETASIDELAEDLFAGWEQARPTYKQLRGVDVTRRRRPRTPLDAATRRGVYARLGLDASAPATLGQAAELSGVSAHRIAWVSAVIRHCARLAVWAPTLDQALALADPTLTTNEYSHLLQEHGLAGKAWHPDAIASLARLCGRTTTLRFADTPATTGQAATIRRAATTLAKATTLTSVAGNPYASRDPVRCRSRGEKMAHPNRLS